MKRILSFIIFLALIGCHGDDDHNGMPGKRFLNVDILENNTVIATVNLPDIYHDGILYFVNGVTVLETVINTGSVDLGVFPPGEYTLCVELNLSPDGEAVIARKSPFFIFKNLSGTEECCIFVIDEPVVEPPDDELPPEPEDPKDRFMICHNGRELVIPWNALQAHLAHGDTLGMCGFGGETEVEVEPVFRISTEKPNERYSVIVFGRKFKVSEECSDENLNQSFAELGVVLPASQFPVEYHPAFEPVEAFEAISRAFDSWEAVTGDTFDFSNTTIGTLPPARDNTNVVGWRLFTGKGGGFLAAAFIWDNGTNIIECDIFYNLRHKWAVNAIIEPGSIVCGNKFDIQAVGAHEIGHMLGLGHVARGSDATMAPTVAKGELQKQTLTPGDKTGAITVSP